MLHITEGTYLIVYDGFNFYTAVAREDFNATELHFAQDDHALETIISTADATTHVNYLESN